MKEFLYLLRGKNPPKEVQLLTDINERKGNIASSIEERGRIALHFISGSKLFSASSMILKIIKKGDSLYLIIDSVVPASLEKSFLKASIFLVSYKVENVACAFVSKIVGRQAAHKTCVASFPTAIHRMQRRMYYRIETTLSAMVHLSFENGGRTVKLPIHDISEGGVSFFMEGDAEFVAGEKIPMLLHLNDGAVIQVGLTVRNIVDGKKRRRRICGEFTSMGRRERERIARYVFQRQMEEIQRRRNR